MEGDYKQGKEESQEEYKKDKKENKEENKEAQECPKGDCEEKCLSCSCEETLQEKKKGLIKLGGIEYGSISLEEDKKNVDSLIEKIVEAHKKLHFNLIHKANKGFGALYLLVKVYPTDKEPNFEEYAREYYSIERDENHPADAYIQECAMDWKINIGKKMKVPYKELPEFIQFQLKFWGWIKNGNAQTKKER